MVSKDNYSVIKVVERYARRIHFQYQGTDLSPADTDLLVFAFTGQFALSIDLRLDVVQTSRSFIPFLQRNEYLDVIEFGRFLKAVDGVIKDYTDGFSGNDIWDYTRFKHACDCDKTYWDFIAPVKPVIEGFLLQPSPISFRVINQWLNFVQRANCKSLDIAETLRTKYIQQEAEMHDWVYDPSLLDELAVIIDEWCEPFDTGEFIPCHGPGSIAGRKGRPTLGEKYNAMGADVRLEFIGKYIGDIHSYSPLKFGSLQRVSEVVFVPKSLITQRVISKEPASLQYFQQGTARCLTRMMKHSSLGRHVDLERQELSQALAKLGSVGGKYATLDLSDASDSVTKTLVKGIFRKAVVRNLLFCTRSDQTLIQGMKLPIMLEKFAPMGSTTCFPVETIVFAACCELAVRRTRARKLYYRVYGDDIIIDSKCVEALLGILDALHFKVNMTKSFFKVGTCQFREACGGEYLNGTDVSPLRIPRKLTCPESLTTCDVEVVDQYVSLANRAFDFGYVTLRYVILEAMWRMSPYIMEHMLYSTDGRHGLITYEDCCTNYRLESRFDRSVYERKFRALTPVNRNDTPRIARINKRLFDDDVRLFEWFRTTAYRGEDYSPSPDSVVSVDLYPKQTKLCLKWVLT